MGKRRTTPSPKTVIIEFNRETLELGYEPAISSKVQAARNELKKMLKEGASYTALDKLKMKYMNEFRHDPLMESFDWSRYSFYARNGEPNNLDSWQEV